MGRASVRCTAERTSSSRIPHWRDYLQFYEYFHGDNGAGLGANHQTGWTGLVAKMIELYGRLDPQKFLQEGKRGVHAGGKTGK